MAGHKRQRISLSRCVAFGVWAAEHPDHAQDTGLIQSALRCTEQQAHALAKAWRDARKRPARKPKPRSTRRRAAKPHDGINAGILGALCVEGHAAPAPLLEPAARRFLDGSAEGGVDGFLTLKTEVGPSADLGNAGEMAAFGG